MDQDLQSVLDAFGMQEFIATVQAVVVHARLLKQRYSQPTETEWRTVLNMLLMPCYIKLSVNKADGLYIQKNQGSDHTLLDKTLQSNNITYLYVIVSTLSYPRSFYI